MKSMIALAAGVLFLAGCGGQSAICKKYLDCLNGISPGSATASEVAYGPNGTCWQNTTVAAACDVACQEAVNTLRTQHTTVAACQ